eukprot:TRINITY_DN868_c0_g1_i1.p1 TRINITY_DN868_c0_g1~~TRINITY_DN868_c0_g1_i1.p1  ORF type:complete len:225 (+),score=36.58 TRINITY_DN868_c0_g1_i1:39-677(+)
MSDKIQLYTFGTPNGVKVSITLEELGLEYDVHKVALNGDNQKPEYLAISPTGKIPAITDPKGPNGKPHNIFESGAILLYLAEKTGKLISKDPVLRSETIQWVFFQVGGIGPFFGQYGHFTRYAPEKIPYAIERYAKESRKFVAVLDKQLEGKEWLVGNEYSIADIINFSWLHYAEKLDAVQAMGLGDFKNVLAWIERIRARPAVQRGLKVPE